MTTSRGPTRTRKIVYASNGYTASILPQYANMIAPCRSICSRIKAPAEARSLPHLSNTYCIRQGPGLYDYLIPSVDGSIVVGGARSVFAKNREVWYGVSDDSKFIEPAQHYFDGYMQRTFRGWEDSGAVTDKIWTGSMLDTSSMTTQVSLISCSTFAKCGQGC